MSVEPLELMSDIWTRWQGHVIHDVFPLGRFLGCSDHSGVFQTKSAALGSSVVAIKLVPTDHVLAQSQLPQWERAGGIVHPHLLRLLQWGECELDGFPYQYVVMEYADQTLAQVLQRRALTDEEALEMLRPTLDALAFMHGQNLVQGQLKPENILVVGEQLKLASDTIRRVGEGTMSAKAPTKFDPPEARQGSDSTAGDIWALGICLYESLTRRAPPSGWGERSEAVEMPPDFSPAFKDIVPSCLSHSPQNRPSATELLNWAGGQGASSVPEAAIQPAAIVALESTTPEPPPRITPSQAAAEATRPAPFAAQAPHRRALFNAVLGAAVIFALGWTGVRMVGSHGTSTRSPALERTLSQAPGASAPVADVPKPDDSALSPTSSRSDLAASTSAVHEVMPDVPPSARQRIREHIKVRVRIIVDPDGSVIAASANRIGHSRYFTRLAIEAARKWIFPPIDSQSRRVIQIGFDFGRDETTGGVLTLATHGIG